MALDILPDSRSKNTTGTIMHGSVEWVRVFCMNCGVAGGRVPKENMDFVGWLCIPCVETHGKIAGTMLVPDEVYYGRVKEAQIEKYGRELQEWEITNELSDPESLMSLLARDRKALTPR